VTYILSFLFVLGVLIFVHELGHFLAARRLGVRVLTFSLGFGPKILKVTRGDTVYCVSAIPLGGYVKMAGENPEDPRSGQPDEFLSKTKWQRFQILIAGPLMNLVLAVIVTALVLMQGVQVEAYLDDPPVVGVVEAESAAARGGIQAGDRILSVDGKTVENWEDLLIDISMKPDRPVLVRLQRGSETREVTVTPVSAGRFESGELGVKPDTHPYIYSVQPGSVAEAAGFKAGDVVVSIAGTRMVDQMDLRRIVSTNGDRELLFVVRRDGQELELRATPKDSGSGVMIGVTPRDPAREIDPGIVEAFKLSIERNIELSALVFRTVGGLLTGNVSVRQLQGPVGIAQLSGESAQAGWIPLFTLMALISLQLGILNLLPVPVLDGGHILIMAIEGIARRDFSMAVKEKMLLAGFVMLMMLMVTVVYNDLTRISWIERLMPWRN
jgi:regulator of sigma E protease